MHEHDHAETTCCSHTHCAGEAMAAPQPVDGAALFRIPTMDCAAEEAEIRHALERVAGIRALGFQLGARTLAIDADPVVRAKALDAIRGAGFQPQPLAEGADTDHHHALSSGVPRLVLALGLALGAELLDLLAPPSGLGTAAGLALAAAAIALSGLSTYRKGLAALRHARLNINALMSVAVTGAFVIGEWPEAAMVMALYALAELIEARSVDRARNAIQALMALAPEQAEVQQPDGTWQTLPAKGVAPGALVRVRPGERFALDGVVQRGRSTVDQSPVTGESLPVDKAEGDAVFAGTVNQQAELVLRVSAAASDSTLARIIHTVEQAQGARAPTQRFVDRFAAVYTPAVFVLALGVAVAGPALAGWSVLDAVYKALVLLVIACPCALVISTPVTVVSALAHAARRGILVKGGVHLENARRLKVLALDKTGTLTEGRPKLQAFEPMPGVDPAEATALAAALAGRSDHPVSRAIADGLGAIGTPEVDEFSALPGRGVAGRIAGVPHVLGNRRLLAERGQLDDAALRDRLAVHDAAGRTVTLLASDTRVLALAAVADPIKPTSRDALAALQALGVHTVMLSGDQAAAAQAIAAQAGIADVRAELLPQDKLAAIEDLRERHGPVGMAGDGINDAPALARADLGFAMGAAGTDIAMEAADVVVMNDDLRRIAETLHLLNATHAVLRQNIALALGIKAVFFGLALAGLATMWMAVFADMGASLLVVGNGLRLLRQTAPQV